MIPQSFIQELLSRVDVVEVVGRHVQLRKAGANYLGLCPFHGEKTPSFTVSPSKQFYHCFGCGAHGSAIGFLMEFSGLSYVDAIGALAQDLGMEVPREDRGGAPKVAPGVMEVLAAAARFYKARLRESPRAIEYLKRRGVTGETAARFAIGYAPDAWHGLEAAVPDYAAPELLAAGLVIEPEGGEGRRRYDRFRDRIVFPIRNARGQVIGFGGRVLDRGEPKYLNSPETAVFSKGRELYGLYEARDAIRREDAVIVVEGYMDVVMLAQHGVGNAVATLGTATTPQHVQKLVRLADRVTFAFDGDAAGRKAAWRALEASLAHALDTKRIEFLFLPPEHDPDSFVRAHGADGLRQAIAAAQPLSEFLVSHLGEQLDLASSEGRARLQAEARPLLLQMPAAALRQQLIARIAQLAGVSVESVERYVQAGQETGERGTGAAASAAGGTLGGAAGGTAAGAAGAVARHMPRGFAGGPNPGRPYASQDGPGRSTEGRASSRDGRGGWYPGSGPRQGLRGARRPPPPPTLDLAGRVRLVSARYPVLAERVRPDQAAWLPHDLTEWLVWLRGLPADSSYEMVLEALAEQDSEAARALTERAAAAPTVLGLDEASEEFDGAITELQRRSVRAAIDALSGRGTLDGEDRHRFEELMGIYRSLSARRVV